MHTKRSKMSMVDSGGSLYVMGGFDGSTTINSVECYNPATNRFVSTFGVNVFYSLKSPPFPAVK